MKRETIAHAEFTGTPRTYLRIAIGGAIALNAYLYLGMIALVYGLNGQTWILGWKPALIAALFTVFFARTAYRWIMRLDAQYGSGKSWKLESQKIKLPERVSRPAHNRNEKGS